MTRRVVSIVAVAVLLVSGCIDPEDMDNAQGLRLVSNSLVSSRNQCQVRKGSTEVRLYGVLDVAIADEYLFFPQVENTLPESGIGSGLTPNELRLDNNLVTILGASIHYDYDADSLGDLGGILEEYQGWFSHASGSAEPGEMIPTQFPIIPWELVDAIASSSAVEPTATGGFKLIARITVHGVLADHTLIRSNEFWYPITVCAGCLVYHPPGALCEVFSDSIALPCFPGQDDGIDSRACYYLATTATQRERCCWQQNR